MVDTQTLTEPVPLFIGGKAVSTSNTFAVANPENRKEIWRASSASVEDATKAVAAAKAAFPAWSQTKPAARRDIFLKAANLLEERKADLETYMKEETGAEGPFINFNITATASQIRDLAGRISSIQGSFPTIEENGRSALILKEPLGVVFGIAPWNAPYILGCRAFSYALAAGNTVVMKGSELSPKCFHALVSIFQDAGLPSGCLNLIFTDPANAAEVTTAVIADPAVAKINFTGSTAVGRIIASIAGKNLKPVLLELGGKASTIVLKDANLEKAAVGCTLGSFLHSGQVCMATERVLVHSSIVDQFTKVLKGTIDNIFSSSNPAPILITPTSVERVKKLASDAVEKGAVSIHGEISSESTTGFRPVILSKVNNKMDLYYAESFGPIVSLFTFETEEEALEMANDTEYGLAGAVFTENLAAGLRVAKKYTTGAVHINHMSIHDEAALPHGGMKNSGFGRFNGSYGLEEFLRTKVVTWED